MILTDAWAIAEERIFVPLVVSSETPTGGLSITNISDNRTDYQGSQIPKYEKFELTFHIDGTVAQNFQLPYDPSPPDGIDMTNPAYQGISVDAQFTPDNWVTVYTQPAFYYKVFEDEIKGGDEWFYPTSEHQWKVRFSPDQVGTWQYKLMARDADGLFETSPQSFVVKNSLNRGFVRVSQTDPRYFEWDDGTYFSGLGHNMNYDKVSWYNPVLDNESNFQVMAENGVQLVRTWLSQWGIYGTPWNPWNSIDPALHGGFIPFAGLTNEESTGDSEVSMVVDASHNPCMFVGVWKAKPAVRRNTDYRVRVRYKTSGIDGPRVLGNPYGFVAKTGGWLWGNGNDCFEPGTGMAVTQHQSQNISDWQILEGTINTGNNDFLPNFYLVMENVDQGKAYVDYVWIEEDLGNDLYGPNIMSKPWMAHHLYMEQRNSYAFDKLLELAEQNDIYLKAVIQSKHDWILNHIDYKGNPIPDDPLCWDSNPANDPDRCPGNDWFYGNFRDKTKVRWLQQAWWRYIQARWGYSPSIHSWEVLNEGDPSSTQHYVLTDEFGAYMRQFTPNNHLVTTSFWFSFPADQIWANPDYPNVDYADVHAYISTGWLRDPVYEGDAMLYHRDYSQYVRNDMEKFSNLNDIPTKPVIRGELGIDFLDEHDVENPDLDLDFHGVWLHNLTWASLDPGALIELYWYEENIEDQPGPDGQAGLYEIYNYVSNFLKDIPLTNGNYQDAEATLSDANLRVVGQKDVANGRAHLWVQNQNHTWRNVVDGVNGISGLSGTLTIEGFSPNTTYDVEWHAFSTQGVPTTQQSNVTSNGNGKIDLSLPTDPQITDVGIKIGTY